MFICLSYDKNISTFWKKRTFMNTRRNQFLNQIFHNPLAFQTSQLDKIFFEFASKFFFSSCQLVKISKYYCFIFGRNTFWYVFKVFRIRNAPSEIIESHCVASCIIQDILDCRITTTKLKAFVTRQSVSLKSLERAFTYI